MRPVTPRVDVALMPADLPAIAAPASFESWPHGPSAGTFQQQPALAPPARRRSPWRGAIAVAVVSGVLAAAAATAATLALRPGAPEPAAAAEQTITVAPAPAPTPVPLPTDVADRQTCEKSAVTASLREANQALSVLPPGVHFNDLEVQQNSTWMAAVRRAGELRIQAGDLLDAQVAPGASPILAAAAHAAADSLRLSGSARITFEKRESVLNVSGIALGAMDDLCDRLAPK